MDISGNGRHRKHTGHHTAGDIPVTPDRIRAISPSELTDNEPEETSFKPLEDVPRLGNKKFSAPFEILSPDELEDEEEFVNQALPVGSYIRQRYQVLRIIGQWRNFTSYLVADTGDEFLLGRPSSSSKHTFFLKEIIPAEMPAEELRVRRDRFLDIIRIINTFKHPNLAEVYFGFFEHGREYSLMEHIDGLDLRRLADMSVKPFKEKDVVKWGLELCDALEFLHYRPTPFTIGDLQPSNIMVTVEGTIKIVGYDLQRFFDTNRTLAFMPTDPTTLFGDITKLARILYFLLTKQEYTDKAKDIQWPAAVSKKMQKLLETACMEGQQSFGDIRVFKDRLAATQNVDEPLEALKKSSSFPLQQIDMSFLKKDLEKFKSRKPALLLVEAVILVFCMIFAFLSTISARESYHRPHGKLMYVYTAKNLTIVNPASGEVIYRRDMPGKVSVVYPLSMQLQIRKNSKPIQKKVLLVGYKNRQNLDILDSGTLVLLGSITCNPHVTRIIHDNNDNIIYALHSDALISVIDPASRDTRRVLSVGIDPVDIAFIPAPTAESQQNQDKPRPKTSTTAAAATPPSIPDNTFVVKRSKASMGNYADSPSPLLVVSDPESNSVLLVDAQTGETKGSVLMSGTPGLLGYSSVNNLMFTCDTNGNSLAGINLKRLQVQKEFPLGASPVSIAVDEEKSKAWIAFKDKSLAGANLSTGKIQERYQLGKTPTQISFDKENGKLWILHESPEVTLLDPEKPNSRKRIVLEQAPVGIVSEN